MPECTPRSRGRRRGMLTPMRRVLPLIVAVALTGCSSVREVRLTVRDASTLEPVRGVRVRAISLDSGTVPLPLNDATLDEILSMGAAASASTTDSAGGVRLGLRSKVAHVVELVPPPLGPHAPAPGDPVEPERFVLGRDARGAVRADAAAAAAYMLEVSR